MNTKDWKPTSYSTPVNMDSCFSLILKEKVVIGDLEKTFVFP